MEQRPHAVDLIREEGLGPLDRAGLVEQQVGGELECDGQASPERNLALVERALLQEAVALAARRPVPPLSGGLIVQADVGEIDPSARGGDGEAEGGIDAPGLGKIGQGDELAARATAARDRRWRGARLRGPRALTFAALGLAQGERTAGVSARASGHGRPGPGITPPDAVSGHQAIGQCCRRRSARWLLDGGLSAESSRNVSSCPRLPASARFSARSAATSSGVAGTPHQPPPEYPVSLRRSEFRPSHPRLFRHRLDSARPVRR